MIEVLAYRLPYVLLKTELSTVFCPVCRNSMLDGRNIVKKKQVFSTIGGIKFRVFLDQIA